MLFTARSRTLVLAAALIAASGAASDARIWPKWSVAQTTVLDVDPGFKSLAGPFTFSLPDGEGSAAIGLNYDAKAHLTAAGQFTDQSGAPTLFALVGSYVPDLETGGQAVHFADATKNPQFTIDGNLSVDGSVIVGTFQRKSGYFGISGDESGAITLTRTGAAPASFFPLSLALRMDDHGRIFGAPTTVGTKTMAATASATLYGTHFVKDHYENNAVLGGRIGGSVKTRSDGTSTGVLTISGPKWKARLAGPVDAAGFHATCSFSGGGFVVSGLSVTLPVVPGPTPPTPPPTQKPPPNQLTGAAATIVGGAVTITSTNVPKKFFGAVAGLTIQFPQSDFFTTVNGHAIVHADPSDASTPAPNARRCIVSVGGATYGTANTPADVTLDVDRLEAIQGGRIELLATGTVATADGKTKSVDILVEAVVQ